MTHWVFLTPFWFVCVVGILGSCNYEVPFASITGTGKSGSASQTAPELEMNIESEVIYFYDRGCSDCEIVDRELLPAIVAREGVSLEEVRRHDVADPKSAKWLLFLEERLGFHASVLAPVIIARGRAYCGKRAVQEALELPHNHGR